MARTLLLDLDGTLVDTVPDLTAAVNRLMQSRGLPGFARPQVAAMVGDGVAILVARAFAARQQEPDQTAIADFTADYEAHVADESALFPDVRQTLQQLADDAWHLAVCTNKPERAARALLQHFGLLPLISAVGAGDSFAVRKPDPKHLLATLAMANCLDMTGTGAANLPGLGLLQQAVMLGDNRNDVLAARGAGISCIFAGWGYGSPDMADGSVATASNILDAALIANRLVPVR